MNPKLWVASSALLAAMPVVQAQQSSRTFDPADLAAPVPPTVYRSALAGYSPALKEGPTPDKLWRAANDTVGGQASHGAHHTQAAEAGKAAPPPGATQPAAPQDQHKQHCVEAAR